MNTAKFLPARFSGMPAGDGGSGEFFDLMRFWTIIRRNIPMTLLCVAVAIVLGSLYLRAAPPVYVAQTDILLDENIESVSDGFTPVAANMQLDNRIASQIEVLRSSRLALEVVDKIGLVDDPVFQSPPSSPLATVTEPVRAVVALFRGALETAPPVTIPTSGPDGTPVDPAEARRQAAREGAALRVQQNLNVQRVDRSSVLSVSYRSHDPELTYRVTKAYADVFLNEQRAAVAEATTQATGWMEGRLGELGQEQRNAALAVEQFRVRNNLSVAQGELLSEQRLSNLTSQIATGQAEVAQAQARSDQMQSVLSAGANVAIASAALSITSVDDPVVQQLQARYAEMSGRISQIVADFGAGHPQAVQLSREREAVSAQLVRELQRLAGRLSSEYDVARSRQTALEAAVSQQTGLNAASGDALVELRELQQQAETLNTIYANLLARYEGAMQRQNFPVTNFRVISQPTTPERPSGPRFVPIMAVFAFLGLVAGGGIGVLREFNERSYRVGDDLAQDLRLRFLGYLPVLSKPKRLRPPRFRRRRAGKSRVAPSSLVASGGAAQSVFAETLRNVSHAFATLPIADRRSRVIGVGSAVPDEGKTTVAISLARLLVRTGSRVIVVDADLRRPALKNFLPGPVDNGGLAEAIRTGQWRPFVQQDEHGVSILPTPDDRDAVIGSSLLSSPAMTRLVADLSREFDVVILDLPPLGLVVDAKIAAPLTDGLLLVVRWGRTVRSIVRTVLAEEPEVAAHIVGAVLNGTDLERLRRYGERGSRERVYRDYGHYYDSPS